MGCRYFRSAIGALVGGAVAVAATPFVLTAAGLTAGGVTAGSAAAWAMSLYGVGAVLQSAGAAGLGYTATKIVREVGEKVGSTVAEIILDDED